MVVQLQERHERESGVGSPGRAVYESGRILEIGTDKMISSGVIPNLEGWEGILFFCVRLCTVRINFGTKIKSVYGFFWYCQGSSVLSPKKEFITEIGTF